MSIMIGNVDIGKTVVELDYQTRLNAHLIREIIIRTAPGGPPEPITTALVNNLKRQAMNEVNAKYGPGTIVLNNDELR